MGLFSPSFMKPGKGVSKNEPQKRSFFRFFDIFFRKFWHLIRLNCLYVVCMIPTFAIAFLLAGMVSTFILSTEAIQSLLPTMTAQVSESEVKELLVLFDILLRFVLAFAFTIFWGMGPATAGFTYVLRNFAREEHAWIWADFKDAVKSNFKQSLIVYLLDVIAFVVFFVAFVVYGTMTGLMGGLRYVMVVIFLIYTLMHQYIYIIMVTFELKLKDIYRNAFLFAIGKLPSNLFVVLVLAVLHLGLVLSAIQFGGGYTMLLLLGIFILNLLILQSFSGLLVNFNAYPKIKEFMLDKILNKE